MLKSKIQTQIRQQQGTLIGVIRTPPLPPFLPPLTSKPGYVLVNSLQEVGAGGLQVVRLLQEEKQDKILTSIPFTANATKQVRNAVPFQSDWHPPFNSILHSTTTIMLKSTLSKEHATGLKVMN
jgi:hypothetical protein